MAAIDDRWTMEPGLRAALLRMLERAAEAPADAFYALGFLSLCRAGEHASGHRALLLPFADSVAGSLELGGYAERVDELVDALENEPPEDGLEDLSWKARATSLLDERQRIALTLRGLDVLGVGRDALSGEHLAELMAADQELEAQLWRLTVLNEHREKKLEAIAPEHRGSLWWYARGAQLSSTAVTHLGAVSSVVACFPEAGAELEALRAAEALLLGVSEQHAPQRSPESAPSSARVIPLDEQRDGENRSAEAAALTEGEVLMFGEGKRKSSVVTVLGWTLSAAAVLVAVGTSVVFKSAAEKSEKEKAALISQAESFKAAADENVKRLEEQIRTASTMTESQKASLERRIEDAKSAAASASDGVSKRGGGSAAGARPSSKPASSKPRSRKCTQGDPMCAE